MQHIKRAGRRGICEIENNKYSTLQGAISSIPAGESGVIHIYENLVDLPKLVLNAGSKVTICCERHYGLTFTGDIVELGNSQELHLHEMFSLIGEEIKVNGDAAVIAFEGCLYMKGYITSTSGVGAVIFVYVSSLESIADHPVIKMDSADVLCIVGYSRLKGAVGQPAVLYSVSADSKLKAKFSTFIHGNGNGSSPIDRVGSEITNDVSIYSCAGNADLAPAPKGFTNLIGGANNTVDTEVSF